MKWLLTEGWTTFNLTGHFLLVLVRFFKDNFFLRLSLLRKLVCFTKEKYMFKIPVCLISSFDASQIKHLILQTLGTRTVLFSLYI